MDSAKVLVTGASGYLGSSLSRAFRKAGFPTYGLTRDHGAARLLERDEINPVVADVRDREALREARDIGFDVIVSNTEDYGDPEGHYQAIRDMLEILTANRSGSERRKPLVMFTSGSKDYGNMDEVAGDPNLRPHTERSPVEPHPFAAARARFAQALLDAPSPDYDITVLRPALMYGHAAGLFGLLFEHAAASEDTISLKARPRTVMHGVHVDDSAAAYVLLAKLADRSMIASKSFNIANAEFETTQDIAAALAAAYGKGLRFGEPDDDYSGFSAHLLANTSQWVDSTRIRQVAGWTDVMPGLAEGMPEYRRAYEASKLN